MQHSVRPRSQCACMYFSQSSIHSCIVVNLDDGIQFRLFCKVLHKGYIQRNKRYKAENYCASTGLPIFIITYSTHQRRYCIQSQVTVIAPIQYPHFTVGLSVDSVQEAITTIHLLQVCEGGPYRPQQQGN